MNQKEWGKKSLRIEQKWSPWCLCRICHWFKDGLGCILAEKKEKSIFKELANIDGSAGSIPRAVWPGCKQYRYWNIIDRIKVMRYYRKMGIKVIINLDSN